MSQPGGSGAATPGEGLYCHLLCGTEQFALATADVREVLERQTVQAVPRLAACVAGLVPYRGDALVVVSLRALLGGSRSTQGYIVVLSSARSSGYTGLLVDDVLQVRAVIDDAWMPPPAALSAAYRELLGGVCRLNGAVLGLLNAQALQHWIRSGGDAWT